MTGKSRLVVFSPMPPQKNGIADYWYELLPHLQEHYDITVVVENGYPDADNPAPVIRLSEYLWQWDTFADDLHVYQLGNNPGHVYMLPVLVQRPGVVVLHDLTLHHLVDCATLRWGDFDSYCEAIATEYGQPGAELARQFRDGHLREVAMFYELPMTRLIASRSLAVIVHSAYGQVKVLAQEPEANVVFIPHHVSTKVDRTLRSLAPQQARRQLGYADNELLLVSLGFITRAKQVDKVLEALATIRSDLPPFRYVLAGHSDPYDYDVEADIRRHGLEDVVEVTGYLSEEDFFVYARAADMIFNLRYPSGGETSGTLIRSLGLGACVVVADVGPFAELPADTCVKLPWDEFAVESIARSLLDLGKNPKARSQLGARARAFAQREHSITGSAQKYSAVLEQAGNQAVLPWEPQAPVLFPLRATQQQGSTPPLWLREMLVPLAGPDAKAVVVSSRRGCADLLEPLGYRGKQVATVSAAQLADDRSARRELDLVLFDDPAEDAHRLLAAANRRLRFGGCVVLAVAAAAGTPLPDLLQPMEEAIAATGFEVLKRRVLPTHTPVRASEVGGVQEAAAPCWCAVKVSEFTRG
jgi:glycosyltransferase involved in cell wall biosynthesis